MNQSEQFISIALEEAKKAFALGEVPIGAVLVNGQGQTLSKTHNLVENRKDPSAHAEILAIRDATSKSGKWRLEGCTLFITLEPCPMCMAAIRLARISSVVYGAVDSRMGTTTHAPNLLSEGSLGPIPVVTGGIMSEACTELLQRFF